MADIEYERYFRKALKVDEAFLQRVTSLVSEFIPGNLIEVVLETDGRLTITTQNLSEILSSELIQTDTIKKISIGSTRYREGSHERISFEVEKGESFRTCVVRIKSSAADKVIAFKSRLEELIRSSSLWYSIFRPNSYGASVFVAIGIGSVFLLVLMVISVWFDVLERGKWLALGTTFLSNVGVVSFILILLSKRIFPGVVFNLGLSGRRAEAMATFKNIVFVVIGLGLLISILANVLYDAGKRANVSKHEEQKIWRAG